MTQRFRAVSLTSALPRNAVVTALAAACAIALLASNVKPAHATAPSTYSLGNLTNIAVMDRNTGQSLPMYRHEGEYWVAGTPGGKYSVSIGNRLGERVLAVVSVDGVNVLSGETAGVNQQGYVFNRYQNYNVSGWRKSDHEIAAFTFVASPKSYAERTGRPENVGTIGVAVFRERVQPVYTPPRYYGHRYDRSQGKSSARESESSAPAAPSSPSYESPRGNLEKRRDSKDSGIAAAPQRVEESLGTGHGRREYDSVSHTQFDRDSSAPAEVIRIRYDSYANLLAMGVIRDHDRPHHRSPNPFPETYGQNSYVPDPPRWYR